MKLGKFKWVLSIFTIFAIGLGFKLYQHYKSIDLSRFENLNRQNWIHLSSVSPNLIGAIVISEDWSFYDHKGFDVKEMVRAIYDYGQGKKLRGASTITQQVVKNIFLTNERTLSRKVNELIIAFKLENNYSKDEILEAYINIAEFGGGAFGVSNASMKYFNKSPSEIKPHEAAFLATALPNPNLSFKSYQNKSFSDDLIAKIHRLLNKMRIGKIINQETFKSESEIKLNHYFK